MAFPAISAVHDGYKVFAVIDASGTYSKMAEEITLARIVQAGVVPMDTAAVASELQRTWHRDDAQEWAQIYTKIFPPYQMNQELVAGAAPHAVFMHCLPAHRGEEITDAVMDCERSVVFDQAESRLHVQKAIMTLLLGGKQGRLPVRSAHA